MKSIQTQVVSLHKQFVQTGQNPHQYPRNTDTFKNIVEGIMDNDSGAGAEGKTELYGEGRTTNEWLKCIEDNGFRPPSIIMLNNLLRNEFNMTCIQERWYYKTSFRALIARMMRSKKGYDYMTFNVSFNNGTSIVNQSVVLNIPDSGPDTKISCPGLEKMMGWGVPL